MRRLHLAALAAATALATACGGSGSGADANPFQPDADPFAPDGPPCVCDAPIPDANPNTSSVFSDDFATFPSSKWTSDNNGSQTGTGSHATGTGNPAPSLDVGDAGDSPDGTALRAAATWTSTDGYLLTADVAIPTASATAGAASQVTVAMSNSAGDYTVDLVFTIQNNTAINTPFPGPAGLGGSIIGDDTMWGKEFQTPISSPDDAFHTLTILQDGAGNLSWTWDGTSQAVGTGFPAGSTVHLDVIGTHLDPGGGAPPAGSIYVDNVEVTTP
jgi:hypothetical protein